MLRLSPSTYFIFLSFALVFYLLSGSKRLREDKQNMASAALKALVVNPVKKHTATVIFVHGLGDSGLGWQSAAEVGEYS
jgi:hypothetical protein